MLTWCVEVLQRLCYRPTTPVNPDFEECGECRECRGGGIAALLAALLLALGSLIPGCPVRDWLGINGNPPAPLPGKITGVLVNADTGAPIAGAAVELVDANGGVVAGGVTDANGGYVFENLPAGGYTLRYTADGYNGGSRDCAVGAGATVDVPASLTRPPGRITGRVLRAADGAPVAGAEIALLDGANAAAGTATTGADGGFAFENLPAGGYTVQCAAGGYQPASQSCAVANGAATEVLFELALVPPPLNTLAGRVVGALDGAPIAGVSVTLLDGTGTAAGTATTDENGQYTFEGLPDGDYSLRYEADGYEPTTQTCSVNGGGVFQLVTALVVPSDPSPGTARAQVIDAVTGNPVAGASVRVFPGILHRVPASGAPVYEGDCDADGYFTVALPGGTYTAFASHPGYAGNSAVIYVLGGRETSLPPVALSPVVTGGEVRIILSWGTDPSDLDSHLTGPSALGDGSRFHLYYPYSDTDSPEPTHINLDLDDTSSYGPETTTIYMQYPGVYRFTVHDYDNWGDPESAAMSNSGARVTVITSAGTREFQITPNTPGNVWVVFELDSNTGQFTFVNQILPDSDPDDIQKALGGLFDDVDLLQEMPAK